MMNCPLLFTSAKKVLFLTLFTLRTESTWLTHTRWQPFKCYCWCSLPKQWNPSAGSDSVFSAVWLLIFFCHWEKKYCHLLLKSSSFFSSPSSWPSTPAVIILSRMCWYHLTRFMLINKTQWPWLVRTDLQCLSCKCPQMPGKGAPSCRPLP